MADLKPARLRSVRVLFADDHDILRETLQVYLKDDQDIEVVGVVTNGKELLDSIPVSRPDVIITDIKMPGMDGIEATRLISDQHPEIPILAFTVFGEEHMILRMLKAGARGYLTKNAPKEEMLEAIRTVLKGDNYFCKSTSQMLIRMIGKSHVNLRNLPPLPSFSEKEHLIITHICEEKSNKEIAHLMNLNQRTLESVRERIFKKMGVRSTPGMIIYAIRHGLYQLS
jgi:DNA-binding NarL/FixJ family response regulator